MSDQTTMSIAVLCPRCDTEYLVSFELNQDEKSTIFLCDDCYNDFVVKPHFTLVADVYKVGVAKRRFKNE